MKDNLEIIKDFATLFRGREDVYGSWEGGCIKQRVTPALFMKHLWGQEYIGIYPQMEDHNCIWGCSDIDVNDIDLARNVQLALKMKDITSWVEKTVKGFHVWVFADAPVEARLMRRALLAAHAVVKVPAKEINPKQEIATNYGNYVRLPYPGELFETSQVRYIIDSADKPMHLDVFVNEAMKSRTNASVLLPLSELYIPKQSATIDGSSGAIPVDVAKTLLSPYAHKMFMGGPNREDADRSTTLVRLAYQLRADGIPAELAYGILRTADIQWGKFYHRLDGERYLVKIVEDVYGE